MLIARKLPRIHALAWRMLADRAQADDIAQEAFLRTWKQAARWQTGQARFDTWLHRVVLNLCRDRLRGRRDVTGAVPDIADPSPAADRRIERAQTVLSVKAAMARLPSRQREAIMLHVYQELSNVDAAEAMGVTVEALESLLSRARRALRGLLEGTAT